MTDTATVVPNRTNGYSFDELIAITDKLATDRGNGKDAQFKWFNALIEGAYHGGIDLLPDKHGTGKSDAFIFAARYATKQGISTMFDAKPDNERKLMSNVTKGIRFGQYTKGGTGEPLGLLDRFKKAFQDARKKPENKGKLEDPVNGLLRLMTAQLKRDNLIDDNELKNYVFKAPANAKTQFEAVSACRKSLQRLRDGKLHGGVVDNSAMIIQAISCCTARMKEIADASNKAKEQAAGVTATAATVGPTAA